MGITLVGVSWGRRPTGGIERDLLWRIGLHDYRGCYDPSSVASMLETQTGWWVNSSLKMQDLKQRENPHFSSAWKTGKSGVAFWLGDFLGEDALLLWKDSPFCSLQVFSFFHEPTHLEEGCLFYALCHSNANAIKKCTDRSTQNNTEVGSDSLWGSKASQREFVINSAAETVWMLHSGRHSNQLL